MISKCAGDALIWRNSNATHDIAAHVYSRASSATMMLRENVLHGCRAACRQYVLLKLMAAAARRAWRLPLGACESDWALILKPLSICCFQCMPAFLREAMRAL